MLAFLPNALALSSCRRRASSPPVTCSMPEHVHAKVASSPEASCDEDCRSTATSASEQIVESSSDSSDDETTDVMPNSESSDSEPSVMPAKRQFAVHRKRASQRRIATSVKLRSAVASTKGPQQPADQNSSAPCVRPSIKSVISALDDWVASKTSEDLHHCSIQEEPQNPPMHILKEALGNLSPQEVSMMKALLDCKLASQ